MKKTILAFFLILFTCFFAFAQSSPIDLIVLLDISTGMSSSYEDVNNYLTGTFLSEFLRVGDTFHFIAFSEDHKLDIARRINGIGDVETVIGRMMLQYPIETGSNVSGVLNYAEQYITSLPARPKKIVLVSVGDSNVENLVSTARQRLNGSTTLDYVQVNAGRPLANLPSSGRSPAARTAAPAPVTSTAQTTTPSTTAQTQPAQTQTPAASTPSAQTQAPTATTQPVQTQTQPVTTPSAQTPSVTTPSTTAQTQPVQTQTPAASTPSAQTQAPTAATQPVQTQTQPVTTPSAQTPSVTTPLVQTTQTTPAQTSPAATQQGQTQPVTAQPEQSQTPPAQTTVTPSPASSGITSGTSSSSQPSQTQSNLSDSWFSSIPFIIALIILALLVLGLIIFFASRKLGSSPSRVMTNAASTAAKEQSADHSKDLARFASNQSRRTTPYDNLDKNKPVEINPNGPVLLNLFVDDQNTNIGKRNIHSLKSGYKLTVGGGKSDDFLVFLVPMPARIGEIRRNGSELVFTPYKPKYFPDIGSSEVRDCINKTIRIISDKNYEMRFRFEMYEDPLIALNRILMSVNVPI